MKANLKLETEMKKSMQMPQSDGNRSVQIIAIATKHRKEDVNSL